MKLKVKLIEKVLSLKSLIRKYKKDAQKNTYRVTSILHTMLNRGNIDRKRQPLEVDNNPITKLISVMDDRKLQYRYVAKVTLYLIKHTISKA